MSDEFNSGEVVPVQYALSMVVPTCSRQLFSEKRVCADPEFCQRTQAFFVSPGHGVFFSTAKAECVFSSQARLDFLHVGGIDQDRAVNTHESVCLELFRHCRNGLTKQIGSRSLL